MTFRGLSGATDRIALAGKAAKNAGVAHLTAALVPTNASAAQASGVAVSSSKPSFISGSTPNALTLVGADDDSGPGAYSKITFNAVAGGTYYLAVGGYDHSGLGSPDESGKLRVTVTPPGYVRRDAKATLAR